MDFAGKVRRLERRIARSVDAAMGELVGPAAREPVEILHAVLDHAEQQVQEAGHGRRVFPFTRVVVHLLAPARDREARARLLAVIEGPPQLADRLRNRLLSAGCPPTRLSVEVVFQRNRAPHWCAQEFHVQYERRPDPMVPRPVEPGPAAIPPKLKVAVLTGTAERHDYVFATSRVDIGRRPEVLDARQHLVRTNHLAFTEDGPDANRSVSRRHAHIEWNGEEYRLCDDRSAHGTRLVRDGRTIPVPAGPRGVRLQPGDNILLGQARLRVAFTTAPPLRRP